MLKSLHMVGYNNDESIRGIGSMTVHQFYNSDDTMRMHNRADFFAGLDKISDDSDSKGSCL